MSSSNVGESPCRLKWKNMSPQDRCKRKARRACCCIFFLLIVNTLMMIWIASRTSFAVWWLADPEHEMVVQVEGNTFCKDLCANMKCGGAVCNAQLCINQCDDTLQDKLDLYKQLEAFAIFNVIKNGYQRTVANCPRCKHHMYKDKDVGNKMAKVECPLCEHRSFGIFASNNSFCWLCSQKWKILGNDSKQICGNANCKNFCFEVNEILVSCDRKKIGRVEGVPSVRACVKCSQLIRHEDACKHMDCPRCATSFCFVCLKPKVDADWQCGSSGALCAVAPVQSDLNFDDDYVPQKEESFNIDEFF